MIHGVGLQSDPHLLLLPPPPPNTTAIARPPQKTLKRANRLRSRSRLRLRSQLELRPPPYPLDGLEPYMSRGTVELQWGRHCRGHVECLNKLIAGTELEGMPLHHIVLASYNKGHLLPPFNHAAQLWNHDFFWHSMNPSLPGPGPGPGLGPGPPSPLLLHLIHRDFGSFHTMLQQFHRAAVTHFGSGWVWLLYKANRLDVPNAVNPFPSEKDNKLVIANTPNAVNPLVWDYSPLLALDVWEHAYYLDYENRRADYVSNFLEKLVSWEVVSSRLETAIAQATDRMKEEERRRQEGDEEMAGSDAVEMYLDNSENDDAEAD